MIISHFDSNFPLNRKRFQYTDHDQEQLIATIAAPQQHTVHAQVVEDINAGTITAHVQDVKDVINQFLPARKRKPRAKKSPGE